MSQFKPESQAPEHENALGHAIARQQRRRRRWLIVKLLVLLVVLLLGGVVYLQSTHALMNIYLPLLSRRLGAQITAEDGAVTFAGRADLVNVDLTGPDKTRIFHADRVTARTVPFSLLGSRPHIREATLDAAQTRVAVDKEGRTNWDFLLAPPKQSNPRPASVTPDPAPRPAAPKEKTSITIDRFRLNNAQVQYVTADELDLTLTRLDVTLDQFGRGQTGAFGLDAEGYLDRPGIHQTFDAAGRGSLAQDATGRDLGWSSTLDARLQPQAQPGATTQTVTLQATLEGKTTGGGRLEQDFAITAATGEKRSGSPAPRQAGTFKGTVRWDPARKEHQAVIDANNVSRELLNPFLAMAGPVQLMRSQLNGTCRLQGQGDVITIETRLTGNDLAFRVGEQQTQTPPVSLVLAQRGAFNLASQLLKLDEAGLTIQEKGKPVLETKLDRPVELQVGQGAAAAAAGTSARFNTTLTNLAIQTLQPWLIMAGVQQAADVRSGVLNGQILSTIENAGGTIVLDGQVRGTRMILPRWKNIPLDVTQSVKGRIEKLETITLAAAKTSIANAGRPLADVETAGNFQVKTGAGQADVKLVCAQAAATARTLGWLAEKTITVKQDGRLEAVENVTIPGGGRPVAVKGTATLAGVVLAGPGDTLPLAGKADYAFTVDAQALAFQTLKAAWTAAGAATPATLDLKGNWPLAAGRRGEIKLTARGIDLVPWLRLTAQPGAVKLASLPLEADETLTALENGANKLAGELRIGPIPANGIPAETDSPVAINIKTTLDRVGGQVQSLVLELAAKTRKGATDKIAFNGNGTWGAEKIALRLGGRIEQLHADGYVALAGLLSGETAPAPAKTAALPPDRMVAQAGVSDSETQGSKLKTQSSKNSSGVPPSGGNSNPSQISKPKSQIIIDVTPFEIGKIIYQKGELADAKGSYRFENGTSDLKLETGKLCGGGISGNVQFDGTRAEPRYSWEMALKQVDAQALGAMIRPDIGAHLTGRGDLASRGSGEGLGAGAGRRLQSESGFQLTSGEIRNFFLLDALAKQTKIPEFQNLQFFEFSGRIHTEGGIATLKDWIETGKDQRVSLEGTLTMDGKYDLFFQPAVTEGVAGRLSKSGGLARQLLTDSKGFVTLPVQVAISGQGSKYQLGARAAVGKEAQTQATEQIRGVLQGVIEQRLQKQQDKDKRKQEKAPETAKGGLPGLADALGKDAPLTTPTLEKTSPEKTVPAPAEPAIEPSKGDGLDSLFNQGLQMYQQREKEKKDKAAEKKRRK